MKLHLTKLSSALLFAAVALAQPVDIGSNGRGEPPSRFGVTAIAFDLNPAGLRRGAPELQLQLPGGPMTILRRKSFQSRGPNSGKWQGAANGRNDSEVLLTLRNGVLAGTIQIGPDLYEIRPQGSRHIVEKLDSSKFPQCKGQVAPARQGDTAGTAGTTVAAAGDVLTTVDVLSVYTPQARAAAGSTANIEAQIQSAVDRANLAFTNSQVNAAFRLVRAAEVVHDDAGNLDTDLSWVLNDPTVASLRNSSGADLVSLIVENGAGYCGLGYVMRSVNTGFAPYGFQVTARGCAVGNLSYAHEHGHNSGMEHDPANGTAPSSASYPWSFGHLVDGVFRTVMSYASQCPSGCTRMPYFSNPNVLYSGYPTGVPDQRDNARTARSTLPVVAQFRAEAPTTPPVAPTALTASAVSAAQINLAWADNSANETGFRVERSTDGINFTQIATPGAGVTSFSNTGLTASTAYTYRVRAYNPAGDSDPTNDASATTLTPAPPSAPDSLAATVASSTQINLTWADRSNNETGFRIERSTAGGAYAVIATTGANAVSYASTGLAANTAYSFRIRAYNADGDSAYSNVASATTSGAIPAAPGSFTGAARYSGSGKAKTLTGIALSWVDVANNTGYNIERCLQSGKGNQITCNFAPLTNPAADAASFLDSSATTKGTYQFRIRSFNAVGPSAWVRITVNAN